MSELDAQLERYYLNKILDFADNFFACVACVSKWVWIYPENHFTSNKLELGTTKPPHTCFNCIRKMMYPFRMLETP